MLPTKTDNPNGLYNKYYIEKVNGEPIDDNSEYFILRLDDNCNDINHLNACRKAVLKYADEIENFIPKLAKDLRERYS